MKRTVLLLATCLALLSSAAFASTTTGTSLALVVYADGYVHVVNSFAVDPKATSVQLTLLSATVSDLVATDQNGSPLSYGFGPGDNITVYTLGASSVTLRYDTDALTSKNGTVWTLMFSSPSNSTLLLPQSSTLISTSGTPYSINETGSSPGLALSQGAWKVDYGLPFSPPTSTGTSTSVGAIGPGGTERFETVGAIAIAAVAVLAAFMYLRRRGRGVGRGDLRPDDVQVLDFIRERGGRVLEPEIRTKFALPKTSAWRQIKRLERMGYVKVAKVGSQNQIELTKSRDQGS